MRNFPLNPRTDVPRAGADHAESTELERYGIVRVPTATFLWNGYRYTHARDALAAAQRGNAK